MSCTLPSGYVLVISEKPKAAKHIAHALSARPRPCRYMGAPYWLITNGDESIVVAPVAGHLFVLSAREDSVPVFSYEWVPRWLEKGSRHLRRFHELVRYLARSPRLVVNACDYDVEGSVIGYLVITLVVGRRDYKRMKFSSLTPEELRKAYRNLLPQDTLMVEAGLCRHELDWIYGINLSRLLMKAYRSALGERRVLSVGRVQTPTLVEVVERYVEHETYCRPPVFGVYAVLRVEGATLTAGYAGNPVKTLAEAKGLRLEIAKARYARAEEVRAQPVEVPPPPPFNLNDLQEESYRFYGFSPSYTQHLAEQLYLDGLISYPRTNSQKLPPGLDVGKILEGLANAGYAEAVESIRRQNPRLRPREGRKEDPAHPAIYPTGSAPRGLKGDRLKLYDLVVRRFLAAFLEPAVYEQRTVTWLAGGVRLSSTIRALMKAGWTILYPMAAREERLVEVSEGDVAEVVRTSLKTLYPDKPPLHTKSSLLRWMESSGIGTESTRAEIIELIFERGYVRENRRKAVPTPLGTVVVEVAKEVFPELTSVELTREFEGKVEKVREGVLTRGVVVEEAKRVVRELVEKGLKSEGRIAALLRAYLRGEGERCTVCGGPATNGLCALHAKGLERIMSTIGEWKKALSIDSERDVLERLAKSRGVGKAVREVAEKLLRGEMVI